MRMNDELRNSTSNSNRAGLVRACHQFSCLAHRSFLMSQPRQPPYDCPRNKTFIIWKYWTDVTWPRKRHPLLKWPHATQNPRSLEGSPAQNHCVRDK